MPSWFKTLMILIAVGSIVYFLRGGIYAYTTGGHETVTLLDFVIKTPPGSSGCDQKFIVFTDKGEFENTDSGWRFKWDSTHLQNQLTQLKGKRVVIYYYGKRLPYYSWYPNIYRFELPQDDTR